MPLSPRQSPLQLQAQSAVIISAIMDALEVICHTMLMFWHLTTFVSWLLSALC